MLHQHHAPRSRSGTLAGQPVRLGTVPVGTIFYLQDGGTLPTFIMRAPWIVEAWIGPRDHRAVVRCLRTGQRRTVADHFLRWHDDNDLEGARRESKRRDMLRPGRMFKVKLRLYRWASGNPEETWVSVAARNAKEARRVAERKERLPARALQTVRL